MPNASMLILICLAFIACLLTFIGVLLTVWHQHKAIAYQRQLANSAADLATTTRNALLTLEDVVYGPELDSAMHSDPVDEQGYVESEDEAVANDFDAMVCNRSVALQTVPDSELEADRSEATQGEAEQQEHVEDEV